MNRIMNLENRISRIEKRNRQVERDKAWETSLTRRAILICFTYITLGIYMQAIQIDNPWLNAVIPTVGFYLSTLTLPFFKKMWEKNK